MSPDRGVSDWYASSYALGPIDTRRAQANFALVGQVLCMIFSMCADKMQKQHDDQARVMQRVLHVQPAQEQPLKLIKVDAFMQVPS